MGCLKLIFFIFILAVLPATGLGAEGYSSSALSIPAKIYYRAFTLYTGKEACDKPPEVKTIRITVLSTTMYVGDRLYLSLAVDSVDSDFIIEAFDVVGNFVPSVPVHVEAYSVGRTIDYDPGIIYKDGSMDYWEAIKPGEFAVFVRWACPKPVGTGVWDEVVVRVLESNEQFAQ